jgi:hypothetical protein
MKRIIYTGCLLLITSFAALAQDSQKKQPQKAISSPSAGDSLSPAGKPQKAVMEKKINTDSTKKANDNPPQKLLLDGIPKEN